MFICEVTGRISQPGAKCHKIVIETRPRVYMKRIKNEETLRWEDVEVAKGSEIVREISATEDGMHIWESLSDEKKKLLLSAKVRDRVHFHK